MDKVHTIYDKAVNDTTAPNPQLFHYFSYEYNFLYMPTFSRTQLWCKR
jgi:hypothetical protein